jgi:purine-binding chemotaxis protein CheW
MSEKRPGGKRGGKQPSKSKATPEKKTSRAASKKAPSRERKDGDPGAARSRASKVTLPPSGLAEEILASLDEPPAEGGREEARERLDGPDRVYRFADEVTRHASRREEPQEPTETWVSFRLRGETFGFPVDHVHEVIRVETLTRVPHAPFPVRGITTLRGQILPVVDLRRRLGLGESELRPDCRILVVSSRDRTLGLLVEGVEQVVRILPSRIEPAPEDVLTEQSDYILGVYDLDPGLMILLDLDPVMLVRDPEQIEGHFEHSTEG